MQYATDSQISLLKKLFNERQCPTETYYRWGKQVKLHQDPYSPVRLTGYQAWALINSLLENPRRNLSYSGKRRR